MSACTLVPRALAQTPGWAALQARAANLHLADDPQWHALLHYIPSSLGGVHSTADAPWFFLARDGKTNPAAELNATLSAFANNAVIAAKDELAACAFIGRYRWLSSRLSLPEPQCPRFAAWRARLQPHRVTLVFPSAYLNNPSSMFGHTLLRVDAAEQTEQTRLLAYAVNFGADTGGDGGALFAVKGLTGMYPGTFSVAPYYELVKKYSALENRDIWEYQLNLTADETERLVEHLWELRGVYFDYYFFDENCSYHLLALLDAARPHARLTQDFPAWAIPADTVRAVVARGMVANAVYRPAHRTVLQHQLAALPPVTYSSITQLADARAAASIADTVATLPAQHAATALTSAYDYLHYQLLANKIPRESAAPRLHALLRARSELPPDAVPGAPPTPHVRPDQGHDTARLGIALGSVATHETLTLRVQPAFHELVDPQDGYVTGAQINFLDFRLHYDAVDTTWRTERFSLVDIASLTARDEFFDPWSWQVRAGWRRETLPRSDHYNDDETTLPFQLTAGGGITRSASNALRLYTLATANLELDDAYTRGYALAPGVDLGMIWNPHQRVALQAHGHYEHFIDTADFERTRISLEARYQFAPSHTVGIDLTQERATGALRSTTLMTWTVFF